MGNCFRVLALALSIASVTGCCCLWRSGDRPKLMTKQERGAGEFGRGNVLCGLKAVSCEPGRVFVTADPGTGIDDSEL